MILTAALIVAAVMFPACSCDGSEKANEFLPNVVTVTSSGAEGNKAGSGVLVCYANDLPVLLTNYHVVSGANNITVTPSDGNTVTAELLGYSEYHDVAVLSLTTDHGLEFIDVAENGLFENAEERAEVFSIGNRLGSGGVAVYEGECTDVRRIVPAETSGAEGVKYVPVIAVTCDVSAGMSGGAIVGGSGGLVGLGTYREEDASAFYAVSSRIAQRVLELALEGKVNDRKEVELFGAEASASGYGVYFYDAYGGAGVLATRVTRKLHPLGFRGTFTSEGFRVGEAGDSCPIPEDALISEIGGMAVGSAYADVFFALYGYAVAEGSASDALSVTFSLDGERKTVAMTGGGYSLAMRA